MTVAVVTNTHHALIAVAVASTAVKVAEAGQRLAKM
jgi:hypothetical protein